MLTGCGGPKSMGENPETVKVTSPSAPEPENTEAAETQAVLQQTEATQEKTGQEENKLNIQIGNTTLTATLAENSSVEAFKALMADGPLTLNMSDYANMEKGADLGVTLPENNEPMNTQAGDIILYQGRTFVIYYDTNS